MWTGNLPEAAVIRCQQVLGVDDGGVLEPIEEISERRLLLRREVLVSTDEKLIVDVVVRRWK